MFRTPPTLILIHSLGFSSPHTTREHAAKCTTPSHAGTSQYLTSKICPSTTSMPTTSCTSLFNSGHNHLPTNPLCPVTTIFIVQNTPLFSYRAQNFGSSFLAKPFCQ